MKKRTKFLLLRASIIAVFATLAGRLWYVQVVNSSYYKAQADTSKIRLLAVDAPRGIIYDRSGRPLVFNAPEWNVMIVPHGVPYGQSGRIYGELSRLMGGKPAPARIAWLVQQASWQPYKPTLIKQDVAPETGMVIKQLHIELPGVRAETSSIRRYVYGPAMAHILGYTGVIGPSEYSSYRSLYRRQKYGQTDRVGKDGIEFQLEPFLHGVNGTEHVEVDSGERPIRVLNPGKTVPGDNVHLTIDLSLQQQVTADVQAALDHLNQVGDHVNKAVAVVEDVRSGQVLSMVSLPNYDDNIFSDPKLARAKQTALLDPNHPLLDLATEGMYPPGSTYKIITATAALQTGVADVNRYIDDTGKIDLGSGAVFNGWKPGGLGLMNVVSALAQSSDIYFYTVAGGNPTVGPMKSIGPDRLAYWARQYGLGAATGIELPGEAPGNVPDSASHLREFGQPWHIGDSYNSAIGQGDDLATPLQMASVAATVANGGKLMRPTIVQSIDGRVIPRKKPLANAQVILPFVPSVVRQNFIDPSNLQLVQTGMHQGVAPFTAGGTSQYVVDTRIDAAGKTGTAEALPNPPHAWWVGYAPFNNPQVAVCVMVPNANSEGAYVAAPIAHKVLEDYFHLPAQPSDWLSQVQPLLVGGATQ